MTVTPTIYNGFTIYQGATFNEPLTFRDSDDNLTDFTAITARMKIKKSYSSVDPLVELTTENGGIENGGASGILTLKIAADASEGLPAGNYIYDLELVSGAVVDRPLQGSISVSAEVTK